MRVGIKLLSLLSAVFASTASAAPPATTRPATLASSPAANLLLGNPSGATTSVRNRHNYLLVKPYFTASYNSSKGEPNWVSWVLTVEDLGNAPRKRSFDTDPLPIGFVRIKTAEYVKSGFDRGHICPHSDRAANEEMSFSTFVMTNVIPQAPNLNRRAWVQVEDFARDLAFQGNHVYQIAGGSGVGGVGSDGRADRISDGRVLVPAKLWKIIVVVPEAGAGSDLSKINAETRVIAVNIPNDNTKVRDAWKQYRVSVRTIERETGLTFFTALPPDVAKALKEKTDDAATPVPVPRVYGKAATQPAAAGAERD